MCVTTRPRVWLNLEIKWLKSRWMVHGGAPAEFFGQTHQAHPKLPAQLVYLEDPLPQDVARGYPIQVQWLSAFSSTKTGITRTGAHWKVFHKVVSKLPYIQAKRTIKKGITSKFFRSVTLVLICWDRKVFAEPVFRRSVGGEFNSSFQIYHIDSGTHPAAAFHGSWKKVDYKVGQKKVLQWF